MARFIDPFHFNNFVDANILDAVADGQDDAVNEIVRLAQAGEITLLLPYSVRSEIEHPNTPAHVRRAGATFPFSMEVQLTGGEQRNYINLVAVAKGNAEERNIARDLFHVCEAAKYGGYFITRDKRLLARAQAISTLLQIDVVMPSTFMDRVAVARQRAERSNAR